MEKFKILIYRKQIYCMQILRLLYLFVPGSKKVNEMAGHTLQRLKNTCFGNTCAQGEYMVTGISVLRFLSVTKPDDFEWIDKMLCLLGSILSFDQEQAMIQKGIPFSYILMAYTDIDSEKIRNLIAQKKEWLLNLSRKGWITRRLSNGNISEFDCYNLMGKYKIS